VPQRIGLGRAGEQRARPFGGQFVAVAHQPLDAVAREQAGLLGHLVGRADVDASAETGVLALGIFTHAHHVDIGRSAIGEW
jgi:hypothetical protein